MKWVKRKLSDEPYEAACACDVNGDGIIDIVSGAYWYEGSDFNIKHKISYIKPDGSHFDDFSNIPMDVTGNGYPDIISGGWSRGTLYMRKNPGNSIDEWECEDIDFCTDIETTHYYDIDGDGELEILTGKRWKAHNGNDPGDLDDVFICYYKFKNGKFERFDIDEGTPGECSGIGIYCWVEDVNNDGKLEIIAPGKEGLFLFNRE